MGIVNVLGSPEFAAKFWARVLPAAWPECWLWTGATSCGYGYVRIAGKRKQAHGVAYWLCGGGIPDGLVPDHLCRVRRCVNPMHVEPVTNVVNVMRGESPCAQKARQVACAKCGAPLTRLVESSRNRRRCLSCYRARKARYNRAYRSANREKLNAYSRDYQRMRYAQRRCRSEGA